MRQEIPDNRQIKSPHDEMGLRADTKSPAPPVTRSKLSTNSDSNYSTDRTKSSDEEDANLVNGRRSGFSSRKQTPDDAMKKEENEIPLGADADTLNQAEPSVVKLEEEYIERRNNNEDSSSFRTKPPSTAMSTTSTISTSQLIPSSGYYTKKFITLNLKSFTKPLFFILFLFS